MRCFKSIPIALGQAIAGKRQIAKKTKDNAWREGKNILMVVADKLWQETIHCPQSPEGRCTEGDTTKRYQEKSQPGRVAQLDRVSASEAEGRGFESRLAHQQ